MRCTDTGLGEAPGAVPSRLSGAESGEGDIVRGITLSGDGGGRKELERRSPETPNGDLHMADRSDTVGRSPEAFNGDLHLPPDRSGTKGADALRLPAVGQNDARFGPGEACGPSRLVAVDCAGLTVSEPPRMGIDSLRDPPPNVFS